MRNNREKEHTSFPLKKCLIASAVISIIAFMILALLYTIVVYKDSLDDKSWIFLAVWGGVYLLSLLCYWGVMLYKFIKTRKDEK